MLRSVLTCSALMLTLAGCDPTPTVPAPNAPSDACGASGLQDLLGQPKTVLTTMKFAAPLRVIGPDEAITADYNPDRLNIEYNAAGLITKISCY